MKKAFENTLGAILISLFIVVIVCISLQVVYRYLLNNPLTWTEEVAKLSFMWMVFLGLAMAERDGLHIAVDFIIIRLPNSIQKPVRIAIELFGIVIMLVIGYYAIKFIAVQKAMRSVALDISMMYFSAAIPIGCFLLGAYKIFTINRIWKTRDFTAPPTADDAQVIQ